MIGSEHNIVIFFSYIHVCLTHLYELDLMKGVVLLALCLAIATSEIIPFNKDAIDRIFKDKATTLFLFTTTGKESEDAITAFTSLDETSPQGILLVHSSSEDGHGLYSRLAEYIGVDLATVPTVVYLGSDGLKYVLEGEYTLDTLRNFIVQAEEKELEPFLKSHPIPEDDGHAVKTAVGKTFKSIVLDNEKEALVKFYAPWCGHCKTLAPEFEQAAQLLAHNPNIVLVKVDSTGNEVAGIEVQGYPTLKWWRKDKTQAPIDYTGGRNAQGIVDWIKANTQHPWVEK